MSVIDIEQIFSIGECIGSGSFGDVFEAKDKETGNKVALKRLKYNASLKKEAYPINLKHESIVSATSCIRATQSGIVRDFLVMEWLNGNTLKEELSRVNHLPLEEAINIFIQCAKALHYAHRVNEKRIIHRDIKPSNIFICEDGTLKLTDFSVATEKDGTATADSGLAAGTYGYIAPELFYSASNRGDEESDIFSFGVCFYETITGKNPISELKTYTPLELLEWAKTYNEEHTDFSSEIFHNNPNLRNLVKRCLAWKRSQQFSISQILKFYSNAAFGSDNSPEYDGATAKSMNAELAHYIKARLAWNRQCRFMTFADVLESLNDLLTQVQVKNSKAVSEAGRKGNSKFVNNCLLNADDLSRLLVVTKVRYPNHELARDDLANLLTITLDKTHAVPEVVILQNIPVPNPDNREKVLNKLKSVKQLDKHLSLPQAILPDIQSNKSWAVFAPLSNHTFLHDFISKKLKQNCVIDILNVLKSILGKLKIIHSLRLYHGNITKNSIVIFENLNNSILFMHSTLNGSSNQSLIQNQLQDTKAIAELLIVTFSPHNASSDYLKLFRRHAHEYSDSDDIELPELDKKSLLSSLPELSRILLKMLKHPKALSETINKLEWLVNAKLVDKKFGNVVIGSKDRYEYLGKIVETGGYADVYKTRQLSKGNIFVMKSLKDELFPKKIYKTTKGLSHSKSKSALERAKDESKILKSLQHKNIVKFIDVASDYSPSDVPIQRPPLLVMEYLQGMTLKNAIADLENDYPIDVERGFKWFLGYLLAIEHCHKNGFIHRDVKPDNLFINDDDVPILLDFGIAKDNTGESTNGAIPGTPEYMAPEIVTTGERGDVRTDIFSLGLCLFETLNGQSAYPWRLPESNWEKLCVKRSSWVKKKGTKWWMPRLAHPFDSGTLKVFEKMLHPDPEKRFSNVVECRREISKNLRKQSRSKTQDDSNLSFDTVVTNAIPVFSKYSKVRGILRYGFLSLIFFLGFVGVDYFRNNPDKLLELSNYRYKVDPWYENMALIATSSPQNPTDFLRLTLSQINANKPNEFLVDDILNRSGDYYRLIESFLHNQTAYLLVDFKNSLQDERDIERLNRILNIYQKIQLITEANFPETMSHRHLTKLGNLAQNRIEELIEAIIKNKGNKVQDMVLFRNQLLKDFDLNSKSQLIKALDELLFRNLSNISIADFGRDDFKFAWGIIENVKNISESNVNVNDIALINSLCQEEFSYLQSNYPLTLDNRIKKDDQLPFLSDISQLQDRLSQLPVTSVSIDKLREDVSTLFTAIIYNDRNKLIDNFDELSLHNIIEITAQSPNFIRPRNSYEYFMGERGMSMKISYEYKIEGACNLQVKIDETDLKKYSTISLWVMGTVGKEAFYVSLINNNGESELQTIPLGQAANYLPSGITRDWQELVFPLDFVNTEYDLSRITSLNLSFNEKGKGVIYIDDLMFRSVEKGTIQTYPKAAAYPTLTRGLIVREVNPVLNPTMKHHLFSLCDAAAINTIYVLTHNPDHYFIKESRNANLLIQFLNDCREKKISPNFFMVKSDWSSKDLHSEIHSQIRRILEFNGLNPDDQKISGLLIGLESAQSIRFTEDEIFQDNFLNLLKKIKDLIANFPGQKIELSFLIPREFNTRSRLMEDIIATVDYTILSDDNDNALSTVNASKKCIEIADQLTKKVWIANQTGNIANSINYFRNNTFYEEGWKLMEQQFKLVAANFSNQKGFGGFVIDSFFSYWNLHEEKKLPQNLLRWRSAENELVKSVSYQSIQPINIDGDLKDWSHLQPAAISTSLNLISKTRANDTISCEYYSLWDDDNIYWAFRIFDLDSVEPSVQSHNWDSDHIQLWLDLQIAEDFTESDMSSDDFLLRISPGDFDTTPPVTVISMPQMGTELYQGVKTASSKLVDGYILEVKIPFTVLYNGQTVSMGRKKVIYSRTEEHFLSTPYRGMGTNFFADYQLGFNVVVSDFDYDGKTLISSSSGFISRNPSTFGLLEFRNQSQGDESKVTTAIPDQ